MITFFTMVKVIVCVTVFAVARKTDSERARYSALYFFWYVFPLLLIGGYVADSNFWALLFAGWDLTIACHFMSRQSSSLRNWVAGAFFYCSAINLCNFVFGYTDVYFFSDHYRSLIQAGAIAQCSALVVASSVLNIYNHVDLLRILHCDHIAERRRTRAA